MARFRRRRSTALARSPVVVMAPARRSGRVRHAVRRAGHHARRGGVALAKGAYEEKLGIAAVAGAGVIGFLEGNGNLDFLPDFGIGRVPALAIGTYVAGRVFKSQRLRHAGLGLAAAAAFGFGLNSGQKNKK